jgi:hypothetical protein
MRKRLWLSTAALAATCVSIGAAGAQVVTAAAAPDETVQADATAAAPAVVDAAPAAIAMVPEAAAAYANYQSEVSAITAAPLSGAEHLDRALDTFGAQNPDQLSSGWISYTAMIASQDDAFAAAVRDIDGFYGRDRVVAGMRTDGYGNTWARGLEGGEAALQTALAVNAQDTSRISSAAAFVKEQAYKLQNVAWAKSRLKDASGVASGLKLSARTARPVGETARALFAGPDLSVVLASATGQQSSLWDRIGSLTAGAATSGLGVVAPAAVAPAEAPALRIDPRREGTANRIMTLAALHVLEADATHTEDVRSAMKDGATHDCIDWSQLQLQACVSAAYTRADLSFCLAEHAIGDAGACFSGVAR